MKTDILEILKSCVAEIETLREQVELDKVLRQNLTVRLAINQIWHGGLDCEKNDQWDALLGLTESGRLFYSHNGEVYLDLKLLTAEVLTNA